MNQNTFARYLDNGNRQFLNDWASRAQRQHSFVGYGDDPDRQPRTSYSSGPRDEMVARFSSPCKFVDCGDRRVVAGETVLVKRNGVWGHKSCPKAIEVAAKAAPEDQNIEAALEAAVALRIADAADALLVEFEAGASVADRADALLAEYAAIEEAARAAKRAKAFESLMAHKLVYRIHFSDKARAYGTDMIDIQIVPDAKYGNAKLSEFRGQGVGRIERDGTIRYWDNVDQRSFQVRAVVEAVNVLLEAADPVAFAKAYATESSECARCGDTLVDDKKNPYFPIFGPVCGKKFSQEA